MAKQMPMPGYEVTYITRAEMSEEALTKLKEKVRNIVKEFGGDTVIEEDWGGRKLAYPIGRETRGRYTHSVFTAKGGVIAELERNLRMQEHILRFISVKVADEFDAPKYQETRFDFTKKVELPEAMREERGFRGPRRPRGGGYDRGDRGGYDRGDRGDRGGYDRGDRGGYDRGDRQ